VDLGVSPDPYANMTDEQLTARLQVLQEQLEPILTQRQLVTVA
jgi:hypothetical protein